MPRPPYQQAVIGAHSISAALGSTWDSVPPPPVWGGGRPPSNPPRPPYQQAAIGAVRIHRAHRSLDCRRHVVALNASRPPHPPRLPYQQAAFEVPPRLLPRPWPPYHQAAIGAPFSGSKQGQPRSGEGQTQPQDLWALTPGASLSPHSLSKTGGTRVYPPLWGSIGP